MTHPALKVALAFAAFAVVHSITVSGRFKRLAGRVLGPASMKAYYRLGFTVLSALTASAAGYVIFTQPDRFLYRPPGYVLWPMHLVQSGGVLLMLAAFRPFRASVFGGFSQAAEYLRTRRTSGDIEGMPEGPLVTDGAYGLVRHPMYAGGILMFLFEPNLTVNCAVLRTLVVLYFLWGGFIEERRFERAFGGEYAAYQERVPMFDVVSGIVRRLRR